MSGSSFFDRTELVVDVICVAAVQGPHRRVNPHRSCMTVHDDVSFDLNGECLDQNQLRSLSTTLDRSCSEKRPQMLLYRYAIDT